MRALASMSRPSIGPWSVRSEVVAPLSTWKKPEGAATIAVRASLPLRSSYTAWSAAPSAR
jgi:hypothetical protein